MRKCALVPESVAQLTAAVTRGEEAAVECFYRRFFDLLYRYARDVSQRDESFCLDVVQDAMLRIIRTIRPVTTEAQLVAWLKLIVRSVTYDALRRERRRHERELAGDPNAEDTEPRPQEERLAWVRDQLLRFDPAIVRLIELRFVHDWTLARIAQVLGLTVGTVDGRLRRALTHIRRRAGEMCND